MTTIDPKGREIKHHLMNRANLRRGFAKHKKRMKEGKAFLDAEHEYELSVGDKRTGELKTMTGREAKAINEQWDREHLQAVIDAPTADAARLLHMKRWVMKKGEAYKELVEERKKRASYRGTYRDTPMAVRGHVRGLTFRRRMCDGR